MARFSFISFLVIMSTSIISCNNDKKLKISLAEWSLHKALQKKEITNLDFPRIAREKYHVEAIEFVNQFFEGKAEDQAYLQQLKDNCLKYKVNCLLIMVDGEGAIADTNTVKRDSSVQNHLKWIKAAQFLDCHSVRVNCYGEGQPDEISAAAIDGLTKLCKLAEPFGINVIVENHGGLSSNGAWLSDVIKSVNLPNCGTLPDFGNFRDYDRYKGVAEMMPFAKGVSAKSHDFDATGNETHTDYARMLKIVKDAGYTGFIGIEYEGETMSEDAGIKATQALLEKVMR